MAPILKSCSLVAALGLAGCSLGTGVTPDCNLDGSTPSCDPAPACDSGKGELLATEPCCLERANDEYNLVCQTEGAAEKGGKEGFRSFCPLGNTGANVPCCNAATAVYESCVPKK